MILCCRDDCGHSPRSPGNEPGQQSRNEEGNGQLPETHGAEVQCLFAGRTQLLRARCLHGAVGIGLACQAAHGLTAQGCCWVLPQLLANTAALTGVASPFLGDASQWVSVSPDGPIRGSLSWHGHQAVHPLPHP